MIPSIQGKALSVAIPSGTDAAGSRDGAQHPPELATHGLFHLTMTAVVALLAGLSAVGLAATRISVDIRQLLPLAALSAFLLALAAFYRWREVSKLVNLIMMAFWAVLFSKLFLFPMFILGRMPASVGDATLAMWDRTLGLEVSTVVAVVREHAAVDEFLKFCYGLLTSLMTLAIVVPPMCDRMRVAKEYTMACVFAALISFPVFGLFQARGPWEYYGFEANPAQARSLAVLEALWAEGPYHLDLAFGDGIIEVPSFHTILAVLAAVALWPFRYLRWPAVILAGLIIVSTVTTGWHYLADVWAGLAVAVMSIAAAKGFSRLEDRLAHAGKRAVKTGNA